MKKIGDNKALQTYNTPIAKKRIETALDIMGHRGEIKNAMFQHSVLCQAYLPYRKPTVLNEHTGLKEELTFWEHRQGKASVEMQALQVKNPLTGKTEYLGMPYGTRARLIMAYLTTQAIKTQSAVIDVEKSVSAFTQIIGLERKGRDINDVKNQLARFASSKIQLSFELSPGHIAKTDFSIVQSYDVWFSKDKDQKHLWPSIIELSDKYFNSLLNNSVPLDIRALSALKNSPMALDVYSWLAQRLHKVDKKKVGGDFIAWKNMKDQFGSNFKTMKKFKESFRSTLRTVKLQYRDANIVEDLNLGFRLYNSPTPIAKKTFSYAKDALK